MGHALSGVSVWGLIDAPPRGSRGARACHEPTAHTCLAPSGNARSSAWPGTHLDAGRGLLRPWGCAKTTLRCSFPLSLLHSPFATLVLYYTVCPPLAGLRPRFLFRYSGCLLALHTTVQPLRLSQHSKALSHPGPKNVQRTKEFKEFDRESCAQQLRPWLFDWCASGQTRLMQSAYTAALCPLL